MSTALELIQTVKTNGGQVRVEGGSLIIAPDSVALPILDDLRHHKWEIIRLLESRSAVPLHEADAWRGPFVEWLNAQCVVGPRFFGGLASLHLGFCEWEQARDGVPCTRETFSALLTEESFLIGEIEGTLLVSGLVVKNDAAIYSLPTKASILN
jgi:hypothetical protein